MCVTQTQGDEARAVEAILSGQVNIECQQPPPASSQQQQQQQQPPPSPSLSPHHPPLLDLLHNGFTLSPRLCTDLCAPVLREINRELGRGLSGQQAQLLAEGKGLPHLSSHPSIQAVWQRVRPFVESVVGPVHNVNAAQIAVRFPGYGCLESGMTRTYASMLSHCICVTLCTCTCLSQDGLAPGTSTAPASTAACRRSTRW